MARARELCIIFSRDGEKPETRIVPDGHKAAIAVVMMVASRGELHNHDLISISYYDET